MAGADRLAAPLVLILNHDSLQQKLKEQYLAHKADRRQDRHRHRRFRLDGEHVLPSVTVSSQPARVLGAALAPGFAGLYQIATQLPSSLPNGDLPIWASVGGIQSEREILLTVQAVN